MTTRDQDADLAFRVRFLRTAAAVMALGALASAAGLVLLLPSAWRVAAMVGASALVAVGAWRLSRAGRHGAANKLLTYGLSVSLAAACFLDPASLVARGALVTLLLLVVLMAFLEGVRACVALGVTNAALTGGVAVFAASRAGTDGAEVLVAGLSLPPLILVVMLIVPHFIRYAERNQALLAERLAEADRVRAHAARIARGDLSVSLAGDSALADAVRGMLVGLRGLVARIQGTATDVRSAAEEIGALSQRQGEGATEQSAAVHQADMTLATLVGSAGGIVDAAREVVRAAQSTQENNELIAERIAELNQHVKRIGELLDLIEQIAKTSETLALNASLEGIRAGAAGAGFVVVAGRMQELADQIKGAVATVATIMGDVSGAGAASLAAARRSTALAAATTRSAEDINVRAVQQRQGAAEVSVAVADIARVAAEAATGSAELTDGAAALATVASALETSVDEFVV